MKHRKLRVANRKPATANMVRALRNFSNSGRLGILNATIVIDSAAITPDASSIKFLYISSILSFCSRLCNR